MSVRGIRTKSFQRHMRRPIRSMAVAAVMMAAATTVRADLLQNQAVQGTAGILAANGFIYDNFEQDAFLPLDGSGVTVADIEAGGGVANVPNVAALANGGNLPAGNTDALPNGNADLPSGGTNVISNAPNLAAQVTLLQQTNTGTLPNGATPVVPDNHSSEVVGVIVSQNGTQTGIAPGAGILSGGIASGGGNDSFSLVQQAITYAGKPANIVNMSFGSSQYSLATSGGNQLFLKNNGTAGVPTSNADFAANYQKYSDGSGIQIYNLSGGNLVPTNNGLSNFSEFIDWAATKFDTLMVVSGNESDAPPPTALAGNANQGYLGTAGKSFPSFNTVGSPSDSYNTIDVGATGQRTAVNATVNYTNGSPYNTTNTTSDVSTITGYGRIKTDMVAPGGDPFASSKNAAYLAYIAQAANQGTAGPGGVTVPTPSINQFQSTAGGIDDGSDSDSTNGATTTSSAYLYTAATTIAPSTIAGTSFAGPEVAGGAALLYQEGGLLGASTDHRLIKALMMNGAVHSFYTSGQLYNLTDQNGVPWGRRVAIGFTPLITYQGPGGPTTVTNAQFGGSNPGVRQGLDPILGTGEMNELNSLVNYAAGKQGPGNVNPTGWDTETVAKNAAANTVAYKYDFKLDNNGLGPFGSFQATLAWDDPVNNITGGTQTSPNTVSGGAVSAGNYVSGNSLFERNAPSTGSQATNATAPALLTDLDLYLFVLNPDGSLGQNIDYSTSDIDNTEYIFAKNLLPGQAYELDVVNAQYGAPSDTPYGLAWSVTFVPEPGIASIFGVGLVALTRRRRKKNA